MIFLKRRGGGGGELNCLENFEKTDGRTKYGEGRRQL